MKYAEINKLYTEAIVNYLRQGYVINTSTQSGTYSNEIAHCDLTSGDDLVRVVLMNVYDESYRPYAAAISLQVLDMNLAKSTLKDFSPNQKHGTHDLWNQDGAVIRKDVWYCIRRESEIYVQGEFKGYSDGWWVSKEEFEKCRKVAKARREAEYNPPNSYSLFSFSKARLIAFKFVKKQPRCKTVKPTDIEDIKRIPQAEGNKYIIRAKGKEWALH